jgi:hypothetical protein
MNGCGLKLANNRRLWFPSAIGRAFPSTGAEAAPQDLCRVAEEERGQVISGTITSATRSQYFAYSEMERPGRCTRSEHESIFEVQTALA